MAMIRLIASWFTFRRRLITLALLGWVILVVIGAGRTTDSDEWFTIPDLGGVLIAGFGVLVLINIILLVNMRSNGKGGKGQGPTRSIRTLIIAAIVVLVAAIVLGPRTQGEEILPTPPESLRLGEELLPADDPIGGASSSDIAALITIGVIAAAVVWWSSRGAARLASEAGLEEEQLLESELGAAIDMATRYLQGEDDPRMAVLAAYASLESALADLGQHRDPAETPSEHLRHVLAAVPALTAPGVRLGELYEIARFSDHPITGDDRDEAAAALVRARGTLVTLGSDAQ